MLPRTWIIVLHLSLLTAAASVVDRSSSVGGAKKPLSDRASAGSAAQKRPAAGRRPPARGQDQGSQPRQPARQPNRKPQRKQNLTYLVCHSYPAGSPAYQDVRPSQPFVPPIYGAMYPPYRIPQPANAANRAPGGYGNMLYWPPVGYPSPFYPLRLVCLFYRPTSANAVASPVQALASVENNPDIVSTTYDPNIPFADVDPGMFNLPDDGDLPLPYDNAYGPPAFEPEISYPGEYVTSQPFGYPPPIPFPANF